jgi:hypothetical protein
MLISCIKRTVCCVIVLLVASSVRSTQADTIQEIREKLEGFADGDTRYRVVWLLEIPEDERVVTSKIDAFGAFLSQENSNSRTSDKSPYVKTIEQYLTNGFKTFREGGYLKNGKKVRNETELYSKERPVIGLALFASRYYQARLLKLMTNTVVSEGVLSDTNAIPCYTISGQAEYRNRELNLQLTLRKADCLLLKMEVSEIGGSQENRIRLIAAIAETNAIHSPYTQIRYERWINGKCSASDVQITAERNLSSDGGQNELPQIPAGPLVTDKRFGYGMVYHTQNGKSPLTDEQIAKMSSDPDFRTNKYYVEHMKIISSKAPVPGDNNPRFLLLSIVAVTTFLPLSVLLFRRRRSRI